jgi:hypothetical protein
MPPKSVQTRTPLYAPQERSSMAGPVESFLRGVGVPLDLAGPAAAGGMYWGRGPETILREFADGGHGGRRLSNEAYLRLVNPAGRAGGAVGPLIQGALQEQAIDRGAQQAAEAAAEQRLSAALRGAPTPSTVARPSALRASVRGALRPAVPLTLAMGAAGAVSGPAGRAYARSAGNPTAQTEPRLVPGGAFQPEGSVFRDESIQTQGDVEALLSEMARERARSQAAENLQGIEQALEVERYLRQGAPYVAIAEDFEPLEISP